MLPLGTEIQKHIWYVRIWNTQTHKLLHVIRGTKRSLFSTTLGHLGSVTAIELFGNHANLVTASADEVKLWQWSVVNSR